MKSIYHCHWHTWVNRHRENCLTGKTTFLSTDLECSIWIELETKTYTICKAVWEIYRGPQGSLSMEIDSLRGLPAYLGSGKALRQAILIEYGTQALSMVLDTVRGFIQSESFVFEERGFKDPQSYVEHWKKVYVNSCRYFSNLNKADPNLSWADLLSEHNRYDNLYNRFKSVLITGNTHVLQADASLSDSFHEVGLTMRADRASGKVTAINSNLLRGPYPICFEAQAFSQNLMGQNIMALSKKEIATALGGNHGCVHIIDISYEAAKILKKMQ